MSRDQYSGWDIAKIHFPPKEFQAQISASPQRVVYVYRDVRDVLVSAFFYFNYKGESKWARIDAPKPVSLGNYFTVGMIRIAFAFVFAFVA